MGKILTQDEIDLLLGSANELQQSTRDGAEPATGAVVYDFRRPDRVSKEQVRSLHFLHDRFARNVSASLSAYLRAVTEVSIVSVEQFSYSEFLMSLPDPTAFYAVSMPPLDGVGALELNPGVAFTMIDRMLGGTGQGVAINRALTEIEQNVTDGVVKLILENLTDAWRHIHEVHFRISGRETRPQMLQVAAPNETVILMVFDIRIGEARGMLNFCIPAVAIESIGDKFTQSWFRARREPTPGERARLQASLGRVPLTVTALLETTLPARELLRLRPGDVMSLGHAVAEPLIVKVGRRQKFTALPSRVGQHGGVMVLAGPDTSASEG